MQNPSASDLSDKIQAYKSTTRALESENSLLIYEKETLERSMYDSNLKIGELNEILGDKDREIRAKDEERKDFLERFQRLEDEKMNVLRQFTILELELERQKELLETTCNEKQDLRNDFHDATDTLGALREGKKIVETKLQRVMEEKQYLQVQYESCGDRVAQLEAALSVHETEMAEKISYYEDKIIQMQSELDRRLDEITSSKNSDVEGIKNRYIELFHEKAEELHDLRYKYEDTFNKLESSNRKLSELENELTEYRSKTCQVDELTSQITALEISLSTISSHFTDMKSHCTSSINQLQTRLCDMHQTLILKDREIKELSRNINSEDEDTNSSQNYSEESPIEK